MTDDRFVFHLLHMAHQAARDVFASELTPTQFVVLKALYEIGDGTNQKTLIDHTGVDRSTMTDVLRRLEENGLVTRARSKDDQRAVSVAMTKQGRYAYHLAVDAAEMANHALLSQIPESQRKAFLRNLEGIGKVAAEAARAAA